MEEKKVVLYIAVSVDGYIADEFGGIEWLEEAAQKGEGDNGYSVFYETVDTIVMGNATYEQVLGFDIPFPYEGKPSYVFSRTKTGKDEHVEFINSDPKTFLDRLQGDRRIWLVGGAGVLNAFMKSNTVDELRITYIPILLGKGIPLFHGGYEKTNLQLQNVTTYKEIVELHYKIER
ncbi:dihydrofolate reductase family protein [Ectobacillus antri]|jgi:dihydrofolate reductase|uniref:Dihydrofolate reductase family protein n=1 Tax=Ectobacillus antri TaxID=2486280 RepID=A0ABT6H3R5_9BACI|nr:dihydrofolate reductase family protein [Ectobacillus antri]MDG4656346.1 dihydrofolate reductase family protein [Ectobacillus antri]MDG5753021.1 dihydrofolate reductase family protein [Ectobacillus antri]